MKRFTHLFIDADRREALLLRVERLTELPLLILSFVMIPLLIGPFIWDLSSTEEAIYIALDSFIWAVFVVDLCIKVALTTHHKMYLKKHWLEVLIAVVPFFRPLRIARIFIFGSRAWVGARRLVNVDFILVYGIGLIIIAATVVTTVETAPSSTIQSFPDALYWSVVTITTVGYGDMVPVTVIGRAMAIMLMFGGIAFFSGITANLASYLIKGKDKQSSELTALSQQIELLKQEVKKLSDSNAGL